MKVYTLGLVFAISFGLPPVPSHCQDLADFASQERTRRKQVKHSSKVYTNADLLKYKESARNEERTNELRPGKEPTSSEAQTNKSESDEERAWSQRFLQARRQLLESEIQMRKLQARIRDMNVMEQLSDQVGSGFYEISHESQELEKSNRRIAILKEDLENLREELRKSGEPRSWENSLAGLGGPVPAEPAGPASKDQQHWQKQFSLIDTYYESLTAPLEAEVGGGGQPGSTYIIDIGLLIKELRQKSDEEKKAFVEQAIRGGALPGWFR